jgi:hypothetical protein
MWAPPQNCTSCSIQAPTRERKHKRKRLVLVTRHKPSLFSWKRCTPSRLPAKHKCQRSKKLWDTKHQTRRVKNC